MRTSRGSLVATASLLAAGLLACSKNPTAPFAGPDAAPNFDLTDVNPNSPTHRLPVSPRDYLGQVSAWYFGHAT